MITFADLGPVPTIHLFLRVPVPLPAGGWSWGELPRYKGCMVREYGYSAHECRALVHTYGRMVPHAIGDRRKLGDRFSIYAKGPLTGLTVGLREWAWSSALREYEPVGEYMCGWRTAIRTHWVNTGEMFERRRFDPKPPALLPIPHRVNEAA
jgi:hypothetical protein